MKLVFLTGPFMLYRGSEQKENNVKWKTINTHWSATTLKPLTGKVKIIVSLQCFAVKPRVLPFMWHGNAHLHIALHDGVPCLHMNGAQSVHPAFKLYRIQEHPSYTSLIHGCITPHHKLPTSQYQTLQGTHGSELLWRHKVSLHNIYTIYNMIT